MEWGSLFDSVNAGVNTVATTAGNVIDARAKLAAQRARHSPVPAPAFASVAAPSLAGSGVGLDKNTMLLAGAGLLVILLVVMRARK